MRRVLGRLQRGRYWEPQMCVLALGNASVGWCLPPIGGTPGRPRVHCYFPPAKINPGGPMHRPVWAVLVTLLGAVPARAQQPDSAAKFTLEEVMVPVRDGFIYRPPSFGRLIKG